tara:strand:+ start:64 stop:1101 length:1038 start_codon:yes stop_codon:yes gene_type:complete
MKLFNIFSSLTLVLLLCVSCGGSGKKEDSPKKQKVLTTGVIVTDMNIRSSSELIGRPDDEYNNILYKETKPGTKVEILEFKNEPTKSGFYWCKVKTKSTVFKDDQQYNTGWMCYRNRELPYVISEDAWHLMKKTLGMEYQEGLHYLAQEENKPFLLQGIFDFAYSKDLINIKQEYDNLKNDLGELEVGRSWYNRDVKPAYNVKFSKSDRYSKACMARISTPSKNRKDEERNTVNPEYFVVFEQNPQKLQIFHQDIITKKGKHVFSKDLSYLEADIKSISRISKRKKVYTVGYDYYGNYKSLINLNFDAVRVRTLNDKYFILYNTGDYTNYSLNNLNLTTTPEYKK